MWKSRRMCLKQAYPMSQPTSFALTQSDIPKAWYNLNADFPNRSHRRCIPARKQPMPPEALEAIFPRNLVEQEISAAPWIEIPQPVRDIYALWRPTPLLRAVRLEQALQTPAHIYTNTKVSVRRQPQGEHLRPAGLLQQACRH